jgi:hypothetical protein
MVQRAHRLACVTACLKHGRATREVQAAAGTGLVLCMPVATTYLALSCPRWYSVACREQEQHTTASAAGCWTVQQVLVSLLLLLGCPHLVLLRPGHLGLYLCYSARPTLRVSQQSPLQLRAAAVRLVLF